MTDTALLSNYVSTRICCSPIARVFFTISFYAELLSDRARPKIRALPRRLQTTLGYAVRREAAMAALAKSWRRE
jgi:hypothetical protein